MSRGQHTWAARGQAWPPQANPQVLDRRPICPLQVPRTPPVAQLRETPRSHHDTAEEGRHRAGTLRSLELSTEGVSLPGSGARTRV